MNKIKFFFIKNYQRLIRLFLSFSAIGCIAFTSLYSSAAGSIIDCSQLSSIKVASSSYPFATVRYGQTDAELGYVFGVNSVWYRPVDSSGETPASISDYEMHFDIGTQINIGDTYTLTYDMYFPTNFNSSSQLVMPGFDFNYIASVNGRWETLTSNAVRYWHWQGSATVTAGFSTSDITIIPRGLEVGNWVIVRSLKVSIAGKDYTGAINSTKDEIKANQDKNTSKIISSFFGDDYSSNDTSQADEYHQAEKDLMDNTSSGRSKSVESLRGITRYLDGHIGKSLLSMSKVITELTGITWLNDVLHFSLVLGLFAFVLGCSMLVIKVVRGRKSG